MEQNLAGMNIGKTCHIRASVIVDDDYVVRIAITPTETNAPLDVDTYAVEPCQIADKAFKSVGWWNAQIVKVCRVMQHSQFSPGNRLDPGWKTS